MKKQYWIIVLIVVVLILGYLGRHKIKAMLGSSSTPAPTQTATTEQPSPSASPSPSSNGLTMSETDSSKGAYLADSKGMTLYTFDKDTKGVSNCNGSCATLWPPFSPSTPAPSTLPSNYTSFKRADGSMQYAFNGMPLYYYSKDTKPGDVNGDGVGGVWHLAKP